jgi:vacuolar-type H+-ATPase subunit H
MTQHPITDIHDTEKEAKKMIEDARKRNDKSIIESKEKAQKEFDDFVDTEKTAGKEKITAAKGEASQICKEALSGGEREVQTLEREAEMRQEQAVRTAVKSFQEYVGISN